ncbi:MAG: DUF1549 domain-containing protein, partial [Bryobacterales bacterium]|nr:DUF1549 domain-containing protein [Bryobacterales bacterium]
MRILLLIGFAVATLTASTPAEFFEKEIRPILAERCYGCHSPASQPVMGGLRLDSRDAMLQGGGRGPAIVPGDPAASLLLKAVRHEGALKMPPTGKLRDAEIAALAAWIRDGAVWGASLRVSSRTPVTRFWSFQPVVEPALPAVKNMAWVRSPLDRFILSALESKGLAPAKPAAKRALLRRATFDLTGLPPTIDEINAFVEDNSPEAFARVVERLLASPRYGERWGRHWLDVARYGDSNGLDENLVFVNAWRYRDYVIRAFNEDRPYDRFLHEQLAGDLLPPTGDPDRDYQQL